MPAVEPAPPPRRRRHGRLMACLARRQLRRLRHWLYPPKIRFVYDPAYERILPGIPVDPLRADRILAYLCDERFLHRDEIFVPRPAALKNLLLVHRPTYLESLQDANVVTGILGTPVAEGEIEQVLDHQRLMTGGTIQATRVARRLGCVGVHMGGGFHHAGPSHGMGFCIFNDVAVAIARLRRRGFKAPVLVVDLDLHDGNGTREIFADDPSVYTYSVHNETWGSPQAQASTCVALGGGVTDGLYLRTIEETLPPVFQAHQPGLVVYIAGCDVADDDDIGNWHITADGIMARDCMVTELCRHHACRMVIVLGGGYGEASWRHSACFLGWLLSGSVVEPPDNDAMTLLRFRQIKSQLGPELLTGSGTGDGWELTEEDLVGLLPGIPRQTRFLGFFSKVGLELLLERFGMLQQLRTRGFRAPQLELDLDHPIGQTLRILSDPVARDLLVELRVTRSTRAVPGMEVLVVEWLLLQDPRASFDDKVRPLPGQQHPGLGILREVFGWLVVICETLDLDGLYYYPSAYHLAVLSHRHARFLRGEDEATFQALRDVLLPLPLEEASAAFEAGRVRATGDGQPVNWAPNPMVVPVSLRLGDAVSGPAYHARVDEARAGLSYTLVSPTRPQAG